MSKRRAADQGAEGRFRRGEDAVVEVLETALLRQGGEAGLTHGFHTYPAGLHPMAARDLVTAFEGERVLDPFCGGGTTLVEARVAGRTAIGFDISPIARLVATCRVASPEDPDLTRFRSAARKLTEVARHAQDLPPEEIYEAMRQWYAQHAMCELESMRTGIHAADADIQDQLWAAFSSLLVKVSWRASDTSTKRQKHRRPPGTTAILFHKKVRELARRQVALREAVPEGTPPATIEQGDARHLSTRTPLSEPVQLIVTSPPYPSTYDYLPLQHLRHVWLGIQQPDWQKEIGPRRAWRSGGKEARRVWVADTHQWTVDVSERLETGGHLVVVIGDGLTPAGGIDTAQATIDAAEAAGLVLRGRASVERPDHARNTVRWEHAFAFRK